MKNDLRIPLATIFKLIATAAVLWLLHDLWSILLLLLLAGLIAVALHPFKLWLERWLPRWAALACVSLAIGLGGILTVCIVVPPLVEQLGNVLRKWPDFSRGLLARLHESGTLHHFGEKVLQPTQTNVEDILPHLFTAGQIALTSLSSLLLLYVFTIYLLIDGKCAYEWLKSFFGADTRRKIDETATGMTEIISAYVLGQVITSVLCSIFVYALLSFLKVPAAVMLGVIAGIFDVLPIVGFFLAVLPSLVFAITVSPATALIVLFAYGFYHLFENYVIVPWVYGNRLRLSGLTVLLALLVGAAGGGILGAIIILPLAASYPIIERIWLRHQIGPETIAAHERIEHADEGSSVTPTKRN